MNDPGKSKRKIFTSKHFHKKFSLRKIFTSENFCGKFWWKIFIPENFSKNNSPRKMSTPANFHFGKFSWKILVENLHLGKYHPGRFASPKISMEN